MNKIMIRPIIKKSPYELFEGKKLNISYFHPFGCKCFILINGKEEIGKFNGRSDEGVFLGYCENSKVFMVYNKWTLVWYDKLISFLLENEFHRGSIYTTLFTKEKNDNIHIVQIYVDDIVFGSIDDTMFRIFSDYEK